MSEEPTTTTNLQEMVTQKECANVIQNVLGHKHMAPTVVELDHYNPNTSVSEVLYHLNRLLQSGMLMSIEQDGLNFFTLTDAGYEFLEAKEILIPRLDEIRHDHSRVEKTKTISELENASRPSVSVGYEHPLSGGSDDD